MMKARVKQCSDPSSQTSGVVLACHSTLLRFFCLSLSLLVLIACAAGPAHATNGTVLKVMCTWTDDSNVLHDNVAVAELETIRVKQGTSFSACVFKTGGSTPWTFGLADNTCGDQSHSGNNAYWCFTCTVSWTGDHLVTAYVDGDNWSFKVKGAPGVTPATSISGTITDCVTNAPIVGATVIWGSEARTTNGTGFYFMAAVACETNTLAVIKTGYSTFTQSYTPTCNSTNTQNVCLQPGSPPNGTVQQVLGTWTDPSNVLHEHEAIAENETIHVRQGSSLSACVFKTGGTAPWTFGLTDNTCGDQSHSGNNAYWCFTCVVSWGGDQLVTAYVDADNWSFIVRGVASGSSTSISGRVTDCTTGLPIVGGTVIWGSEARTTDGTGAYSMAAVACETNTLAVIKTGYSTFTQSYTPTCNSTNTQNVCLQPGSPPNGTVQQVLGTWTDPSNVLHEHEAIAENETIHVRQGSSLSACVFKTGGTAPWTFGLADNSCGDQNRSGNYAYWCFTCVVSWSGDHLVTAYVDADNWSFIVRGGASTSPTSITGTVTDCVTGAPIAGALVYWGSEVRTTDGAGHYSMASVTCGASTFAVTHVGYETLTQSFMPTCNAANLVDVCITASAVPVELVGFSASAEDNSALLKWETSSEEENVGCFVYRRSDGVAWQRVTDRIITGGPKYSWRDASVEPGEHYEYEIESVSRSGELERFGPVSLDIPVRLTLLMSAAPNPTQAGTRVLFVLPVAGDVSLRVFDLAGRLVRETQATGLQPGPHDLSWDGRDVTGAPVPAGMYFVRLQAGRLSETVRVVISR